MGDSSASPTPGAHPAGRSVLRTLAGMRSLNTFIIAAVLFVVFWIFSPGNYFASHDNLLIFLATSAEFGIIAVGVGVLMIAGEFDLSVGSVLAFCSLVFARLFSAGVHPVPALLLAVAAGMAIGFINGIITVKAQIPSFIATLGGLLLWRGVTLFWSGGQQQGVESENIHALYGVLEGAKIGFVPIAFLWLVGITLLILFFMHYHKVGNWVYVTGDNPLAAKAMGIQTGRIKIACFMLVGALVGFAAVMQLFRANVFSARAGDGLELEAVAAAVIGGTALTGGIGSIAGVFWGAMSISLIENGLVMMRISYWWNFTVFGAIILLSVIVSKIIEQRRAVASSD
jgi:simple sugar transport system permease protein